MSKMVHMAETPEDREDLGAMPTVEPAAPDKGPRYPCGLCITLTEKDLRKLKIEDMPEVNNTITFDAIAKVKHISQHSDEVSGDHCCIELQITHLGSEEYEDEEEYKPRKNAMKRYVNPSEAEEND